ncbi:MAG: hypothetical protein METHAR1v1_1330003 [Methanothrix sp.]|jgi:hypothetical protein|nr:MAG: hypothetical protein METHAR1v1_1330003 [Methanothrix sp.]
MGGRFDRLFEALMDAAEIVDGFIQGVSRGGREKQSLLVVGGLMAAILLIFALAPGPYEPQIPCPVDGTVGIGLAPPLWWVGGGPATPVLSSIGLDPNSRISYRVLLGTVGEDMVVVGTARGGRGRENLVINLTEPLLPGTAYIWRVEAENRLKKMSCGDVWSFSTRDLPEIELFEADRSVVGLGDDLTLCWSVADASQVEIEPGIGPVSLRGEATLSPPERVTYTLVARSFAGESKASVDVEVLPSFIIDSMAAGWSTAVDGLGSRVLEIGPVPGADDDATRISIDLVPGGWAGITKSPSRRGGGLDLSETDGLSFSSRGSEYAGALEVWIRDAAGTVYARSWEEGAVSMNWTRHEALYKEFGCIEVDGGRCTDLALDLSNVSAIYFVVIDRKVHRSGTTGWIAIDDLAAFRLEGEAAKI